MPGDAGALSRAESCLAQAHGKQPVLPGTTEWHAGIPGLQRPARGKQLQAALQNYAWAASWLLMG